MNDAYPLTYSVDYPGQWDTGTAESTTIAIGGTGLLFLPTLLMLVFREKYPRWWFDFNRELLRFTNRVGIYAALMDDRHPSTDEEQAVHLEFGYPDAQADLNRWLPLVKWLHAIPHYVVLFFSTSASCSPSSRPGSRSCSPAATRRSGCGRDRGPSLDRIDVEQCPGAGHGFPSTST